MRLQKKTISPDELMDIMIKYDQITLQDGRKSKGKAASKDAAFRADVSRNRKGQQKKVRFNSTCHNCSWSGHKSCDCWEKGGGKAGQAPKGWKSHGKKSKDSKDSKACSSAHIADEPDCMWLALMDSPVDSYLARMDTMSIPKLYDSSMSQHLSPSQEWFLNFVSISPKPIRGADNGMFNAIG